MCVAIPARVVSRGDASEVSIPGWVSMPDGERQVDLIMVPEVDVGDYVVVHSGYAIEMIPRERAVETIRLVESAREE